MERLGARDLPSVMLALRALMGLIGMVLLSAMAVMLGGFGGTEGVQYAPRLRAQPIGLVCLFDTLRV